MSSGDPRPVSGLFVPPGLIFHTPVIDFRHVRSITLKVVLKNASASEGALKENL